jgi:methyl-accepting chemotaxis protein
VGILRDIMRQLGGDPAYAARVAHRISSGDLTSPINTRHDDSTSLLAAMKGMQESLNKVISNVRETANRLHDDASQLSVAAAQVANGSGQQSEAAASTAAAIEEMTVSIRHVAASADDARSMADEAGRLSNDSQAVVQGAVVEINKIADSFHHSSDLILNLGEQSNQISAIVNVIKEIADQTNLLALNAAIEAARAGEQGRGFAVVADEVRKLAERTTVSTQEIATMIQAIQSGTQSAMSGMTAGDTQVGEGVRMAAIAGESMSHIDSSSRKVLGAVAEISSALHEQSSASDLISQNIEKIAQMSEESNAAVKGLNHAAEHVEAMSDELKSLVTRFKV